VAGVEERESLPLPASACPAGRLASGSRLPAIANLLESALRDAEPNVMKRHLWFSTLFASLVFAVGIAAAPGASAAKAPSPYRYRQGGYWITATYTCNDGTIVPGPIPKAIVEGNGQRGATAAITAHSVEKLDVAMRTNLGVSLTGDAKAYLYWMLPQVTC
jgi:hypothetical protein